MPSFHGQDFAYFFVCWFCTLIINSCTVLQREKWDRSEAIQKGISLSTMCRRRRARWRRTIARNAHHLTVSAVVQRGTLTRTVVFRTMFIVFTRRGRLGCHLTPRWWHSLVAGWRRRPSFSARRPWRHPRIWPRRRRGLDFCPRPVFLVILCCATASQLHYNINILIYRQMVYKH